MKITFLGAAGEVTGSQHLLETSERRLLLDCGLFQGPRALSRTKNEKFYCNPNNLDGVILSHAHTDHVGNLPGLHRAGFRGPIFCTPATVDVAELMLLDSAHIQKEDVKYLSRKLAKGHPALTALYDEADVKAVLKRMEPLDYGQWHSLAKGVKVRFQDAGHILGSAIVELELPDHGEKRRIVFTGDLGRRSMPLLNDPQCVDGCDVLITESTYGNRRHPPADDLKAGLVRVLKQAQTLGGRVVIPAFSLGRTQQVVYYLNELFNTGALPRMPIFVDSPLARRLTDVFRQHYRAMDREVAETLAHDKDPFGFESLVYVTTPDESKALNNRQGAFVVISASGMCESGRVVHHIRHAAGDERNAIVLIGYQGPGTLGRQIFDRQPVLRIFDREVPLRAHVERLEGLSAHADMEDFQWWFGEMGKRGGIGRAFVVHGEADSANAVAEMLKDHCNEPPVVPQYRQSFEID